MIPCADVAFLRICSDSMADLWRRTTLINSCLALTLTGRSWAVFVLAFARWRVVCVLVSVCEVTPALRSRVTGASLVSDKFDKIINFK